VSILAADRTHPLLEHADFARRDLSSAYSALAGGAIVAPEVVRRVESALQVYLLDRVRAD
jgi:hypothetical protein